MKSNQWDKLPPYWAVLTDGGSYRNGPTEEFWLCFRLVNKRWAIFATACFNDLIIILIAIHDPWLAHNVGLSWVIMWFVFYIVYLGLTEG